MKSVDEIKNEDKANNYVKEFHDLWCDIELPKLEISVNSVKKKRQVACEVINN